MEPHHAEPARPTSRRSALCAHETAVRHAARGQGHGRRRDAHDHASDRGGSWRRVRGGTAVGPCARRRRRLAVDAERRQHASRCPAQSRDGRRRADLRHLQRRPPWAARRHRPPRPGRGRRSGELLLPHQSDVRDGLRKIRLAEPHCRRRPRPSFPGRSDIQHFRIVVSATRPGTRRSLTPEGQETDLAPFAWRGPRRDGMVS